MEFAEQSDDEEMQEGVELISKRPPRSAAPAGKKEPKVNSVGNSVVGAGGRLPIGIAFLLICVVVLSTGFSMLRNLQGGEQSYPPRGPEADLEEAHFESYRASVSRKMLEAAAERIDRTMARIEADWSVDHFPLFKTLIHAPATSWELQVDKFVMILLKRPASVDRYTYVAAFTGSSVTAGHDNYISEMFSAVFNDVLAPIFNDLGIELEVCAYSIDA